MSDDKEYEIVQEGNDIVRALRNRYPKAFWAVVPEQVVVLLVTNKPRPFGMKKLAKITKVDAAHRTVIKKFANKEVKYIIEIYLNDWTQWGNPRKQWIIAHEIGHIADPEAKGLIQHDTQDFGWLLDAVGIDWWAKDNLPNLLEGDHFPFRQELFDRLHVAGRGDDDAEAMDEGGDSHGGGRWGSFSHVDYKRDTIYNSHVLYSKTVPVVSVDEAISIIRMLEHELEMVGGNGIGLAATQIGLSKSIAIIRHRGVAINLINPSIISAENEFVSKGEGCLSLPNRAWSVPRFKTIRIKNHALWPTPVGSIAMNANPNGISFLGKTVNKGMFLVPVEQVFVYENPEEDFGGMICVAVQHEYEHLMGICLDAKDGVIEDFSLATGKNKIGRNDPCGCGSGKKFKRCCGSKVS